MHPWSYLIIHNDRDLIMTFCMKSFYGHKEQIFFRVNII